jgi:hypothetical protein
MGDFVRGLIERTFCPPEALEPTVVPIFATGSVLTDSASTTPRLEELDPEIKSDTMMASWGEPAPSVSDHTRGRSLRLRGIVPGESMPEAGSEPGRPALLVESVDRRAMSTGYEPSSRSRDESQVLSPQNTESSKHTQAFSGTDTEEPASPRIEAGTPGLLPERQAGRPDSPDAPLDRPARHAALRSSTHKGDHGRAKPDLPTPLAPNQAIRPRVSLVQESKAKADTSGPDLGRVPTSESTAVTVTIGRIDVRAVRQPRAPAPQRKATPKPKLSLEDYLKQRDRGER